VFFYEKNLTFSHTLFSRFPIALYTGTSQTYGKQVHDTLDSLIDAVYQAREGPNEGKTSISAHHQEQLETLRKVCEKMSDSSHKKTQELGRELKLIAIRH
jgi:hypothetical protein